MSNPQPQITWYETTDGESLIVRKWLVDNPSANVVFLHGIVSHGGWYSSSSAYLARAGYQVHFLDRRGSGLNAERRGDVPTWQTWLEDVEIYLTKLGGEKPRILAGISWGGKLACAVARRSPELVDGLALLCPGIFAFQQPGFLKRALLKLPLPPRLVRRRVTIPLTDPRLFTDHPRHVSYVADDPLSLRDVTLRFAKADLELTDYACAPARYIKAPVFLALAGRDRIVKNDATKAFVETSSVAPKKIVCYPNAGHTLEFEEDPGAYFGDLARWIGELAEHHEQNNTKR